MRNIVAKQLKYIAYHTVGYDGPKKARYYRYLKRRLNETPRNERQKFFDSIEETHTRPLTSRSAIEPAKVVAV